MCSGPFLIDCDYLMVSKCTPSAMLDLATTFSNLLVVYDDPRDCPLTMLEAIIHDAFHGKMSTTSSKGVRTYRSGLVIGTQEPFFGMKTATSQPTLSRATHIHMDSAPPSTREDEIAVQCAMKQANHSFCALLTVKYDKDASDEVDMIHKHLKQSGSNILDRSLRLLAVDWYFCRQLIKLGAPWKEQDLQKYFWGSK